jgi:hypothetical protein
MDNGQDDLPEGGDKRTALTRWLEGVHAGEVMGGPG